MKIAVCSDLHLEFGPIVFQDNCGADTIVLSGDICVAADLNKTDYVYKTAPKRQMEHSERLENLLYSCSKNFKNTIMIMGNHEHYHGDFAKSASVIREFTKTFKNVHFLDKECVKLDDVTFIGGTLWTNFDEGNGPGDEMTMRIVSGMMNDYRGVKNSNRMVTYNIPVYKLDENGNTMNHEVSPGFFKPIEIGMKKQERVAHFCPADSYEDHKQMMDYIRTVIEGKFDQKFVVCGHHAPSKASTHPRYKHEKTMNTAYSSDLNEFIMDHPQIKLWTHGHTHEDFDYMVGTTRVVCNPRGYDGYEPRADEFKLKVVEI